MKGRLLRLIPDLRAQQQGKEVIMLFDKDIEEIVKIVSSNSDDSALQLVRAAQIIRRYIFARKIHSSALFFSFLDFFF